MVYDIILIVQVLAAVSLIGLVLIQQGKGADMGASFGSGASQTIFGSAGSGNFLTRTTAILAAVFFCASLGLAYVTNNSTQKTSIFDTIPVQESELPSVSVAPEKVEPTGDLPQISIEPVEDQMGEAVEDGASADSQAGEVMESASVSETADTIVSDVEEAVGSESVSGVEAGAAESASQQEAAEQQ